ncbi:hypothetical protein EYZ11_011357 [Aspergillus tanneri]|uniref:Uncharacterized protein n=1 Tax=Aspergillus tanneri TaxID=1220188 RepID=A0A4S3J325_9EURO|nr:hypothetical protein EYZ11_011357 [Aspergillus tanneri]
MAQVIIAVVGSTGAGKSSLINAVADEENIIATSSEIQFIKRDEWERELQILIDDLNDNREDVIQNKDPKDSEAAVAMDKIKAVYPWLEPSEILSIPTNTLLDHPSVSDLLGSQLVIEENSARRHESLATNSSGPALRQSGGFVNRANRVREGLLDLHKSTEKSLQGNLDKTIQVVTRDYHVAIIEPQICKFLDEQIRVKVKNEVTNIIRIAQKELPLKQFHQPQGDRRRGQSDMGTALETTREVKTKVKHERI